MRTAVAFKIIAVSLALGLAYADKQVGEIPASPTLEDLTATQTKTGAEFQPQPIEKEEASKEVLQKEVAPPLPGLPKIALPPLQPKAPKIPSKLPAPVQTPVPQTPTAVSGAPVLTQSPTAISGAPVVTPTPTPAVAAAPPPAKKKDLKDLLKGKQDKKDDFEQEDEEELKVPVYTYSFGEAPVPKEDKKTVHNLASDLGLSGRKML